MRLMICMIALFLISDFSQAGLPGDYLQPEGEWFGQAQYQIRKGEEVDTESHSVTMLTLKIDSGGRLAGESQIIGCRLLGVVMPFVGSVHNLDVTLTSCRHASLNGRYTGTLSLHKQDRYAVINVGSYSKVKQETVFKEVKAKISH